jgi:hypothetical protein
MKTYQLADWLAEAKRSFGEPSAKWKFQCPMCGHIQSGEDFIAAGIEDYNTKVFFSCIGRWTNTDKNAKNPCNWTLGGLFQFHKAEVIDEEGKARPVFEFAPTA